MVGLDYGLPHLRKRFYAVLLLLLYMHRLARGCNPNHLAII
jgi:hypothetical protein